MKNRTGCLLCGVPLKYAKSASRMKCAICGKTSQSRARCSNQHFVCDRCHSLSAGDFIQKFAENADSKDPIQIAIATMRNPTVNMHGPEHHFLVPAALIAAYYNSLGTPGEKAAKIREARRRSQSVLGGFCGFQGACGAGIGAGIFASIVLGATPLSKSEWRLANEMTSRSLAKIARAGGPRCCKRDTFIALKEAAKLANRKMGTKMHVPLKITCTFSRMNEECLGKKCPFFLRAAAR